MTTTSHAVPFSGVFVFTTSHGIAGVGSGALADLKTSQIDERASIIARTAGGSSLFYYPSVLSNGTPVSVVGLLEATHDRSGRPGAQGVLAVLPQNPKDPAIHPDNIKWLQFALAEARVINQASNSVGDSGLVPRELKKTLAAMPIDANAARLHGGIDMNRLISASPTPLPDELKPPRPPGSADPPDRPPGTHASKSSGHDYRTVLTGIGKTIPGFAGILAWHGGAGAEIQKAWSTGNVSALADEAIGLVGTTVGGRVFGILADNHLAQSREWRREPPAQPAGGTIVKPPAPLKPGQ